jgi:nucleotide-binding universal stress UspA family protein
MIERLVRRWLPDLASGNAEEWPERPRVLVPVRDRLSSDFALDLVRACGQGRRGEIILAYVYEVPPASRLETARSAHEGTAMRHLEEAVQVLKSRGVSARYVIRPARSLALGIDGLADELDVDLVLHGLDRAGVAWGAPSANRA